MKEVKENVATVAAAVFTWMVVLVSLTLVYTALNSFSLTGLRELVVAFVMLWPLRALYGADIADTVIEWLEKNLVPAAASFAIILGLQIVSFFELYPVLAGYFGYIDTSLASVFLRTSLTFQDIFGMAYAKLLYGAARIYIESMILYIGIKPLYHYIKDSDRVSI